MINYSVISLYSGSSGNATLICSPEAKILIDAGKNAKALCASLETVGVDSDSIDAIFVTHEHNDHIGALRVFSHKHQIPIYMIYRSALVFSSCNDELLCNCLQIQKKAGFEANIKDMTVRSFASHHDSNASCGYRIDISSGDETVSVGFLTDCGHITPDIEENLLGCESVVLESNHDVEMLMNGPYEYYLKMRIRSDKGHLSNPDCAALAATLCEHGTKNLLLAHLSRENNLPELALSETVGAVGGGVCVKVADPDLPVILVGAEATVC